MDERRLGGGESLRNKGQRAGIVSLVRPRGMKDLGEVDKARAASLSLLEVVASACDAILSSR